MSELTIVDPEIEEFSTLITRGLEAWQRAGEVLCRLYDKDPTVLDQIVRDKPYLTSEILDRFLRVGRRQIFPELLVDGSPGAQRLMALPYDVQVQLHSTEIPVVVFSGGAPVTKNKRLGQLTKPEAERVFNEAGIRSVADQTRLLRQAAVRKESYGGVERMPSAAPSVVDNSSVCCDLNADPKDEFSRLAKIAHDALEGMREALCLVRSNHPLDRHITTGLGAVGQMRFAANEEEL